MQAADGFLLCKNLVTAPSHRREMSFYFRQLSRIYEEWLVQCCTPPGT